MQCISICPSSTMPAEMEGSIYSPSEQINRRLNCTLTLTNLTAGSWIGVFNELFSIRRFVRGQPCANQYIYLSISHQVAGIKYFCGDSLPHTIYAAYSSEEASLVMHLAALMQYDHKLDIFKLKYRGIVMSCFSDIRRSTAILITTLNTCIRTTFLLQNKLVILIQK